MLNKNDPLIAAVQKVMQTNQAERNAVASVNEKFGITDRKALPRERQHEWDSAYAKVLTEGVESLDEKINMTQSQMANLDGNPKFTGNDLRHLRNKTHVKKAAAGTLEEKKMKDDPCWDTHEMVGMKKGKNGNMVPNCVPVDASDDSDTEFAASRRAPKKDRIYGSKKNAKGSAAGGKKIVFSDKVETALRNKIEEHNKNAKPGRKATLPMLKAVYRRGSGAFSSSHRPGKTRDQWAMARVNAFLKLLRSGRPSNPNYKQDNDLLPKAHPKSSRGEASLIQHELLEVALKSADQYGSPEHAIYSMAEYTGLGYEVIPALRGAWLRGVRDGDVPFQRAYELATNLYSSKDADLLPKKRRQASGE